MDSKNRLLLGETYLIAATEIESLAKEGYQLFAIKQPSHQIKSMPALTMRENRCLQYFALECLEVKQIADRMAISDRAVRSILEVLRLKLACNSNTAIIAKYYRSGWHQNS